MANTFKDNISEILKATDYSLDLKDDHLSALEGQDQLKPFFDWFLLNITKDNCVTFNELEQYKILEENGEVLYGKELDEAIQVYNDQSESSLVPCEESLSEIKNDEVNNLKEQLQLKTKLHSLLRSSLSAICDDLCILYNNLQKAESQYANVMKELLAGNKIFSNKLTTVKEKLDELQENLSELCENDANVPDDTLIDTLTSDKHDSSTSIISSTSSMSLPPSSTKCSNSKYLCQLPFSKYKKEQMKYSKVLNKLATKKIQAGIFEDTEIVPELELLNIRNSLFQKKKACIDKQAELEGIKAAREKITEVCSLLRHQNLETCQIILRSEFEDATEDSIVLEESFTKDSDSLNSTSMKWAECETLKAVINEVERRTAYSEMLIVKLDEIIDSMKIKVTADKILCDVLYLEAGRVEQSVELYKTTQEMIKKKKEAVNMRLDVMAANIQDYNDYCALPVEEHSELIELLASVLGSDKEKMIETLNSFNKALQKEHALLYELKNQQVQTILSTNGEMENLYSETVLKNSNSQKVADHKLYTSLREAIIEFKNMLDSVNYRCHSVKENCEKMEDTF